MIQELRQRHRVIGRILELANSVPKAFLVLAIRHPRHYNKGDNKRGVNTSYSEQNGERGSYHGLFNIINKGRIMH